MDNKPSSRTFHAPDARPSVRRAGGKKKRRSASAMPAGTRSHRIVRRKSRGEVRRTRQATLLALYAVLGIEIGLALLTSPALTIRTVRVQGLGLLPPDEQTQTLQALSVPRATNWFVTPLHRLRLTANALPWVREASVKRGFSRALVAVVTPRQPFLALKVGSTWYETDADCVPIRIARPRIANRLPRVVLEPLQVVQTGLPLHDPALVGTMKILRALQQESSLRMAKIVIDQSDNICLNMHDGMEFQFGQSEDVAAKIALVKSIYAKDPAIGHMLASINLSCPSEPACTPRVAQATPLLMGPPLPPANRTQ